MVASHYIAHIPWLTSRRPISGAHSEGFLFNASHLKRAIKLNGIKTIGRFNLKLNVSMEIFGIAENTHTD